MPCGLLTGVPERVPIVGRIQPMRFVMAGVETPPRSIELSSQTSDPMTKSAPLKANLTPEMRTLDRLLVTVRRYVVTAGGRKWRDIPERCVLATWHGNAPSLIVALAKSKPPLHAWRTWWQKVRAQ